MRRAETAATPEAKGEILKELGKIVKSIIQNVGKSENGDTINLNQITSLSGKKILMLLMA